MTATRDVGEAEHLAAECERLRKRVAELEAERLGHSAQQELDALAVASRLNRDIIQSAHEGIIVCGADLRYRVWNPYMERLSGRKAEEVLGRHPLEVFPFLKDVGVIARLEQALAGEAPVPLEFPFDVGGTRGWLIDTSAPLRDDAGRVVGIIGLVQDITERKQAQDALRATSHALGERAKELGCLYGLARLDEEPGTTLDAILQGAVALLPPAYQYPEAACARIELEAATFATPGFRRTAFRQAALLVVDGQHCGQIEVCYFEDKPFFREEEALLGAVAERIGRIAERLRAVEKLRRSEERLVLATRAAGVGIWDWDIVNNELVWDDRMYELYGLTRTSFAGAYEAWIKGLCPDDVARCNEESEAARSGKKEYRTEFRVVWPDGTIRHLRAYAQVIRDPVGRPVRMIGTNFDITERKRAENALSEGELRYRTTLYGIGDAVIATDAEGRVQIMNRVAEELTGWTEGEAKGRSLAEVFHIINEESRAVVENPVSRVLSERAVVGLANHTLLVSRDGRERPIADSGAPVCDEQGRTLGVVLVFRDQTEERAAGHALQAALSRQTALLAAVPDIVMEVDSAKTYTWANEAGRRFFGDDVLGKEAACYFEGEQATYDIVAPLFGGSEDSFYVESWQRRRDGEKRLLAWWCRVLKDETGKVAGALSTARDITEIKLAEAETARTNLDLARRSADLQSLLDAAKAVLAHDAFPQTARRLFDAARERTGAQFGYVALLSENGNESKLLFLEPGGLPCTVDPSLPMPIRGLRERAYATSRAVVENDFVKSQWAGLLPAGHVGLRNVLFAPITIAERTVGVIGLANKPNDFDEEDRQLAMAFGNLAALALTKERSVAALRDSESRYRGLFENALAGIALHEMVFDEHGKPVDYVFLAVNAAFEEQTGLRAEDIIGKPVTRVIPGIEQTPFIDTYAKVVVTGEPVLFEQRAPPLGRHYLVNAFRSTPGHFAALFVDITARMQAEEALRESEERFRGVIDKTQAGYFFIDRNGCFRNVNDAWLKMHGYTSADEILGRHFAITQVDPDFGEAQEIVARLLAGEEIPAGEFSRHRKDGSVGYHTFSCRSVRRGDEVIGFEGFLIDITDHKRAEAEKAKLLEQLHHAQKMEAIGTLAGGLAHDFNNILGGVMSGLSLLELDLGDLGESYLADIKDMKDSRAARGRPRSAATRFQPPWQIRRAAARTDRRRGEDRHDVRPYASRRRHRTGLLP